MSYKMIATWDMSYDAVVSSNQLLKANKSSKDALLNAVKIVEDDERFVSVGYGGLPNNEGIVELDAAYMDGDSLKIGAIAGVENVKNPIAVAYELSRLNYNNMLVGTGASKFAQKQGFTFTNMLTNKSYNSYVAKKKVTDLDNLNSYDGHDTVCMLAKDFSGNISSAVSTSGLFLKHQGRVGDSPISGSGFYADSSYGAAAATGVGEDLMRGCVSYDTIINIKSGLSAQKAVEKTLREFEENLKLKNQNIRAMSIIALDKNGEYGVASNVWFAYVFIENGNVVLKIADKDGIREATKEELNKMSFKRS